MAIKTVATSPSNTMIAIFHFFALGMALPPYWPVIQFYFTRNRGKADDMTVKEKEVENTYSQTSFHQFTFLHPQHQLLGIQSILMLFLLQACLFPLIFPQSQP